MAGSVSGGCVEAAVYEEAMGVLRDGRPRLLRYGVSDETAWEVGLACGGTIEVFVEVLAGELLAQVPGTLLAVATVIRPPERAGARLLIFPDGSSQGGLGEDIAQTSEVSEDPSLHSGQASGSLADSFASYPLAEQVAQDALRLWQEGVSQTLSYPGQPPVEVFIEVYPPPPTLLIFGGVHLAIPLTQFAKALGFRVVVVDPRARFANRERFPHADQIVVAWPDEVLQQIQVDEATYVAVLTHDPKIDEPALRAVLATPARYVGALGSPQTHAQRCQRLQQQGVDPAQLARIHAPIGLDLGATTPEEIALSILAEMVAVKYGGKGAGRRRRRRRRAGWARLS